MKGILRFQNQGQTEEVSFALSEHEVKTLRQFMVEVDRLYELKYVSMGLPSTIRCSFAEDSGIRFDAMIPADDTISALLHRLRSLILKSEPCSFERVKALVGRCVQSSIARGYLKHLRGIYSGQRSQSQIQISSNGKLINSEETLQLWLNAHEYHRDRSRGEELAALHKLLPLDVSKVLFLQLLAEKVEAIAQLAEIVEKLLGGPAQQSKQTAG